MRPTVLTTTVLAAFLATTGCSTSVDRSRGARGRAELVLVQRREPASMNPALENGSAATEWGQLLFSYLLKHDDRGRLVGDAAREVPSLQNGGISADGRTITYRLRPGLRFSDGVPLTARDCVWSIAAIRDPRHNVQSRFAYDVVTSAAAPRPDTLVVHLARPFAPFLTTVLAPQGFPILPEHVVARLGDFNKIGTVPVGSGPFVLLRRLRGDRVVLRANPFYRGGPPAIRKLEIRFVPDPSTALALLQTGEIDAALDTSLNSLAALRQLRDVVTVATPVDGVDALIFNTQDPLTRDPAVRHALTAAIDVRTLVTKAYHNLSRSDDAGRGLFHWAFDPNALRGVRFDPARARALLDAAGWMTGSDGMRRRAGVPLDLVLILETAVPSDAIIANAIVQYERAVGARVTVKSYSGTQFVAPPSEGGPIYGGKFQLALYTFDNGPDPDATDQFACKNVPPGGYNKSRICDPAIDDLLLRGRSTYDAARRIAIYARLQHRLAELLPILPLSQTIELDAHRSRLRGQTTAIDSPWWNAGAWRALRR